MKRLLYLVVITAVAFSLPAGSALAGAKKKPTPAPIQTPTIASVTPAY
jgi:hypothetical protein